MFKYSDFILEKSLSSINESFIYLAPDLKRKLMKVKDDISKDILDIEGTDVKPDITFVDLDKEGFFSFITMRNALKMITNRYSYLSYLNDREDKEIASTLWNIDKESDGGNTGITKRSRNPVRIGRLINQIFPKKYTPKQVEEFVNKLKSVIEKSGERFEIVEGEDIQFWYNSQNYFNQHGSLGNSCMRNSSGIFQIYTMNPEKCRMLILLEDDKLKGRALIWKVDSIDGVNKDKPFEYFLDRQYVTTDSDIVKFRNYAIEKGWAFKTFNSHSSLLSVTFNDKSQNYDMSIKLKPYEIINGKESYEYPKYPYVDTFKLYDPKTGIIENSDDDSVDNEGLYLLEDTGGSYREIEGGFYSEYYDERIPEDRAVYSDPLGDYIYRNSAVYIEHGSRRNRGWWPDSDDSITFDEFGDRYLHVDDCVYSDYYSHYILSDEAINVVRRIYDDGDCDRDGCWLDENDSDSYITYDEVKDMLWFNILKDRSSNWEDHSGILNSLLVSNYKGKFIPNKFAIDVYKVTDGDDIKYLSLTDAYILDRKIDKSGSSIVKIIMDEFEYNNQIKSLYPELIKKAKAIISNIQLELGLKYPNKELIQQRRKTVENRLEKLIDKIFIE